MRLKLQNALTDVDWKEIVTLRPGVRNYQGKKTLFYNGDILWDDGFLLGRPLIYDKEERESWKVIIVLPGVELIPFHTFDCINIEREFLGSFCIFALVSCYE